MSVTFKVKNKKVDKKKNRILETLDSKHMDMIKDIESINKKLPELEKSLLIAQKLLQNLQLKINQSELDINNIEMLDDDVYREIYRQEETVESIKGEISKIKNNDYMNDYFMKTGHLLYDYYDGNNTLGKEFQTKGERSDGGSNSEDSIISNNDDDEDFLDEEMEDDDDSISSKKPTVTNLSMANKKTKITDFISKGRRF
jgi:chromosome segregation ATPase